MAIVVETGTGENPAANSYVSEAELTTYATDRGITLTGTTSELLLRAMDYLESLDYRGTKHTEDQPLQWPRDNVVIDGYYLDVETIPKELKRGQYEAAIAIDESLDPLRPIEQAVKREKVDVIEVEYKDASASQTIVRRINAALWKLLEANGGFKVVRV